MNKNDVLKMLQGIFRTILHHLDLPAELIGLIAGSGIENKFIALFTARLQQLAARGVHATVMKEFEVIGDGLYSMHLTGRGFNIRILYGFMSNGQPALLHAFYERGGKTKTDYSSHIPIGSIRLAEMKKEFDYEK